MWKSNSAERVNVKVLYVTGGCLTKNTSANMSHNGFVKGFLDCGCDVDIIMANDSWGEDDKALPKWEGVRYYEYNAVSVADKLRKHLKKVELSSASASGSSVVAAASVEKKNVKQQIREVLKSCFYSLFKKDPVYPLDKQWLKSASRFQSNQEYDLIVSNSSPASSHRLVVDLLKKKQIRCKRWIQIWEDPWYHDLYGNHSDAILEEEAFLLRSAQEIYYVSPLTLMYQKQHFPDCAYKMRCVPLPYFSFGGETQTETEPGNIAFGYFGDYYSQTRNLKPFYDALVQSGNSGYIYGDSDLSLVSTEKIEVSGRVTLDKLALVQDKTSVLVHLSNLSGGQIPGKIYHYSATTKPILFILDGTDEEVAAIKAFFENINRYYFCENTVESIKQTMEQICAEKKHFSPVSAFEPREVAGRVIHEEKNFVY